MNALTCVALGATDYAAGLDLQASMVQARAERAIGDTLLFPDHPPVLTVGRGGQAASFRADPATLQGLGIPVFPVARGGDVTWHGPGQLIGYPICDLNARGRDLHRFLRGLETTLLRTLAGHGVAAETVPGRTGVWVEGEKIASIGIAVRRWVSYHGFALNVTPDLAGFELIHPCGLRGIQMTSLARRLGPACPALSDVRDRVARELALEMGYDGVIWIDRSELLRRLAPAGGVGGAIQAA
jgi:lipoate-protein ligase B